MSRPHGTMRDGAGAAPAAVVFDADGVLVDTEPAWAAARADLFARHGRRFGPGDGRRTLGTGVAGTGEVLAGLLGAPERADALAAELLDLLLEHVRARPPVALPGAAGLVGELRGRTPLAVASNAPRALLDTTLGAAGLAGLADVVVAADEVARPKPSPDLYVEALRRLGAPAAASVAVEDSPAGAASARAAGMWVIGVPSAPGVRLPADEVAGSLRDASVRRRLGLPGGSEPEPAAPVASRRAAARRSPSRPAA